MGQPAKSADRIADDPGLSNASGKLLHAGVAGTVNYQCVTYCASGDDNKASVGGSMGNMRISIVSYSAIQVVRIYAARGLP